MYMNRNMTIYDKLAELRERATKGEFANWEGYRLMALNESYGGGCALIGDGMKEKDIIYLATLHNAFPTLKAQHDAAQRLVEALEKMDTELVVATPEYDRAWKVCTNLWRTQRDAILAQYREATK